MNEEKTKRTEEIKNKYRKQISAISGERHLIEIQLQQYPLQIKNIKAEQASWERKELEWKRNRLEEIETLIGGKEKERQKCCNNEELLKQEREKLVLQIYEEQRRRKRKNAVLLMLRYRLHTRNCPTGVWMRITEKKNFTSCRMRS